MAGPQIIDLHTHSTASDGTDSPEELIRKAAENNIVAIALTDHDTIDGLPAASRTAQSYQIEFIPGCEISTVTEEGRFHILGLWAPLESVALHTFLATLRNSRASRNQLIIQKLQDHGIDITMEELLMIAEGAPGRPHLAALLVRKGVVANRDEAFTKWLGSNGLAYVPKPVPSTEEAVSFLASIGASPILAHPMLEPIEESRLEGLLKRLRDSGLRGLEAWHSAHTPGQSRILLNMARKLDLGISGGSDYHGQNKPAISLGTGKNNLALEPAMLTSLKQKCGRL